MKIDFKTISPYEQRLRLFEDSEVVCRVDKAKASIKALAKHFYD